MTRICEQCFIEKPMKSFDGGNNKSGNRYFRKVCHSCRTRNFKDHKGTSLKPHKVEDTEVEAILVLRRQGLTVLEISSKLQIGEFRVHRALEDQPRRYRFGGIVPSELGA